MASAKSTSTTRRSSSSRGSKKKDEQEVSPARWAGVAFVIAAIVAAVVLAMVSPSDSSPSPAEMAEAEASPTPGPTMVAADPPSAQPTITSPTGGRTTEFIIPVTVDLPSEDLPRSSLRLLIMRGDEILKEKVKPKTPGTITVEGVEIAEGENELTAVLTGQGGLLGPRSEPILMIVDKDAPDLEILAPPNKFETYETTVRIEGTSEVGAEVDVINETNKNKQLHGVVGPSGEFAVTVPLKRGTTNKIVATSTDEAGVPKEDQVKVIQHDGKPKVTIKDIEPISRAALPTTARIVVDVTDAKNKPMQDAEVYFSLGGPDRTAITETLFTNASGRAVWKPLIEDSSSTADALELTVIVTSSLSEDQKKRSLKIAFK